MIKLVVNPESNPTTHLYNKSAVIIGAGPTPDIDLIINELNIQKSHLKIIEEDSIFYVINQANDPFATVNGMPFGKKILNNQDIIQIGQTLIAFEGRIIPEMMEPKKENPVLVKALDSMMAPKASHTEAKESLYQPDFNVEQELKKLEEEADAWDVNPGEDFDIKDLLEDDESLSPIEEFLKEPPERADKQLTPPVDPVTMPAPPKIKKVQPKIYQTEEFDDENESWKKTAPNPQVKKPAKNQPTPLIPPARRSWKFMILVAISILTVVLTIVGVVFGRISNKTRIEEMKAAEGVADVAMALTYAQINHINPQTQNWSDPEFLKNNLAAIIASDYLSFANIDTHGRFNNTSYFLRIYTNSDFSRFLVMALPAPSVLQWLIPKSAIIVDSQAMELRKIQDLRIFNRLLINPNPLDGANGAELSGIIKKGNLLHLHAIASKTGEEAFSPPKALKLVRPGAENLIYNAPRYYQFGENYMKRAVNLARSNEGDSYELARLQQEMTQMAKLPNLVLYSSEGIEAALQAQKALNTYIPTAKFLNAYLKFNYDGDIVSSHLLMEEDAVPKPLEQNTKVVFHSLHPEIASLIKHKSESLLAEARAFTPKRVNIDEDHPLLLQLRTLAEERQKALQHISEEMISVLINHTQDYSKNFEYDFGNLYAQYIHIDQDERVKIMAGLAELYQEFSFMPLAEVMPYAKAAGLEELLDETIKTRKANYTNDSAIYDRIEALMQGIRKSPNLETLAYYAIETSNVLTLKNIPFPEQVITYQNQLRTLVSRKLAFLIMSPESNMPASEFNPKNKAFLVTILEKAWITSPEEYDFYMNEFEKARLRG